MTRCHTLAVTILAFLTVPLGDKLYDAWMRRRDAYSARS